MTPQTLLFAVLMYLAAGHVMVLLVLVDSPIGHEPITEVGITVVTLVFLTAAAWPVTICAVLLGTRLHDRPAPRGKANHA